MLIKNISNIVNNKINCNELNNSNYISTENMFENFGGIKDASNVPSGKCTAILKDDILLSNIRPYFKKLWFSKLDGGCSNDVIALRVNNKLALSKYVFYALSSNKFFDVYVANCKGTKMPRGNKDVLLNYDIPTKSLSEQQHIVDTIGSVDDLIEFNEQNILKIEKVIIDKLNIFYKNKCSIEAKLGDVFKCLLGGTPNTSKSEFWDGNVNWINSGEVNNLRICKPSKMITELGMAKSATKLLPKGTTVLAITGATLGQISLLEIDSCANQSVVGILENNIYGKEFIYPVINYHIKDLISHQTGGAQPHINKDNIESLTIKLPIIDDYMQYKNEICPLMDLQSNLVLQNKKLKDIKEQLLKKYFG